MTKPNLERLPTCNGWCDEQNTITHIGNKGYVYCKSCAIQRRQSGRERCRMLKPAEFKTLTRGEQIKSY